MIDYTKCNMAAVIQRSYVCQPTLFVEALRVVAKTHYDYSHVTTSKHVAHIAANMAVELRRIATEVEQGCLEVTVLSSSELIQAFTVAAKLNCLPYDVQQDIAKRENLSLRA